MNGLKKDHFFIFGLTSEKIFLKNLDFYNVFSWAFAGSVDIS